MTHLQPVNLRLMNPRYAKAQALCYWFMVVVKNVVFCKVLLFTLQRTLNKIGQSLFRFVCIYVMCIYIYGIMICIYMICTYVSASARNYSEHLLIRQLLKNFVYRE